MDTETKYQSKIFFDGDVLTSDDMNNLIFGIDENKQSIADIDETVIADLTSLENQVESISTDVASLNTKLPNLPNDGQYFLSGTESEGLKTYEWVKNDPVLMFRDPDDDGNIIIGEEDNL